MQSSTDENADQFAEEYVGKYRLCENWFLRIMTIKATHFKMKYAAFCYMNKKKAQFENALQYCMSWKYPMSNDTLKI